MDPASIDCNLQTLQQQFAVPGSPLPSLEEQQEHILPPLPSAAAAAGLSGRIGEHSGAEIDELHHEWLEFWPAEEGFQLPGLAQMHSAQAAMHQTHMYHQQGDGLMPLDQGQDMQHLATMQPLQGYNYSLAAHPSSLSEYGTGFCPSSIAGSDLGGMAGGLGDGGLGGLKQPPLRQQQHPAERQHAVAQPGFSMPPAMQPGFELGPSLSASFPDAAVPWASHFAPQQTSRQQQEQGGW